MSLLDDMFEKEALFPTGMGMASHMLPAVAAAAGLQRLRGAPEPTANQIETDAVRSMVDPAHDAEMKRIQMQAMLAEFLSNDPVISTYDPEQVIEAFNQVSQLTPRASIQPAVMRGQLRKMLQQQDAMEPFEAGQLVDIEKGLKSLSEPSKSPLADYPDIGLPGSGGGAGAGGGAAGGP